MFSHFVGEVIFEQSTFSVSGFAVGVMVGQGGGGSKTVRSLVNQAACPYSVRTASMISLSSYR